MSNAIQSIAFQVRFVVFYENADPKLSYEHYDPFASFTPVSRADGVQFGSTEEMIEALNAVGLPGAEIATPFNLAPYAVTGEILRALGFRNV